MVSNFSGDAASMAHMPLLDVTNGTFGDKWV
jgi:hypothetical protein